MNSDILIREISLEEENAVKEFFEKNLGFIDTIIFDLSFGDVLKSTRRGMGTTFVATKGEKIIGSFSVRLQTHQGKRVGFIDAIVTDKHLRGKGIGRSLFNACLQWLQDRNCKVILATADRYNSPSWNLFIRKGFTVYETKDQIKEFGWGFLRLWLTEFYFVGIGSFFLRKGNEKEKQSETNPTQSILTAWLGLTLVLSILGLRSGAQPFLYPLLMVITAVSILAHESSHILVSKFYGLETVFKAWDSGLLFSLFLSALGVVFPSYGSTYIKPVDWRYEAGSRKMGIIYALGPIVSILLAAVFLTLSVNTSSVLFKRVFGGGYTINYVSALFNLLPIKAAGGFPWDGRKIFTWNKTVWLLLIVGIATLVLIDMLVIA